MSNPSGRIGSEWETRILQYARHMGWDIERLARTGRLDEGDLVLHREGIHFVIEAKAEKRIDLAGYIKEMHAERTNYEAKRGVVAAHTHGLVVVKRRSHNVADAYVVKTLYDELDMLGDLLNR